MNPMRRGFRDRGWNSVMRPRKHRFSLPL